MAKAAKKARRRPKPEKVPPYISPALVARACGISRYKAHTLLRGAALLEKIGERWYAGQSRVRERLPEIFEAVYQYVVLAGDDEGSE